MHLCAKIVCFLLLLYFMITLMFYFICLYLCVLVCANECLYKFAIKNYKYNT